MCFQASWGKWNRAFCIWDFTTSKCLAALRSASFSPIQKMIRKPWARAVSTFLARLSSVSLKYSRRSECPKIVVFTPIDSSIEADTSPVKAPFSAKCMFWAATMIGLPLVFSTAKARFTKEGAITTSACVCGSFSSRAAISWADWVASLFIFQLPAITFFLISIWFELLVVSG